MKISTEAIEAAARAVHELTGVGPWVRLVGHRKDALRLQMREALEASAPHLMAQAWQEGFKQGGPMHDEHYGEPDKHTVNPYKPNP